MDPNHAPRIPSIHTLAQQSPSIQARPDIAPPHPPTAYPDPSTQVAPSPYGSAGTSTHQHQTPSHPTPPHPLHTPLLQHPPQHPPQHFTPPHGAPHGPPPHGPPYHAPPAHHTPSAPPSPGPPRPDQTPSTQAPPTPNAPNPAATSTPPLSKYLQKKAAAQRALKQKPPSARHFDESTRAQVITLKTFTKLTNVQIHAITGVTARQQQRLVTKAKERGWRGDAGWRSGNGWQSGDGWQGEGEGGEKEDSRAQRMRGMQLKNDHVKDGIKPGRPRKVVVVDGQVQDAGEMPGEATEGEVHPMDEYPVERPEAMEEDGMMSVRDWNENHQHEVMTAQMMPPPGPQ